MARKNGTELVVAIPQDGAGDPRTETIPTAEGEHLEALQRLVTQEGHSRGYIEKLPLAAWQGRKLEMFINEDGIGLQLTPNFRATRLVDRQKVVMLPIGLLGPAVVTRIGGKKISPELAAEFIEWLKSDQE